MKRFYREVSVGDGYRILLDGRPVKTPKKAELLIAARRLADAVASEWDACGEEIRPADMPLTRLATSVVDLFPERIGDARSEIAAYAGHDLVCYRAEPASELRARQEREWHPWCDWAERRFGARLRVTEGIIPVAQDRDALDRLATRTGELDPWRLMGLHAAVKLTGSAVLGLALAEGELEHGRAFEASMLDELFEIERWGMEEEQAKRHDALRVEIAAVDRFCRLLDDVSD